MKALDSVFNRHNNNNNNYNNSNQMENLHSLEDCFRSSRCIRRQTVTRESLNNLEDKIFRDIFQFKCKINFLGVYLKYINRMVLYSNTCT